MMRSKRLASNNNQVPEGYKKTELGVIPDDWEVVLLGDCTDKVGSGITPTGGSRVYRMYGRPFIRSQNIGWGRLKLDDLAYIDEETHQSFASSEIKINDVLLNITGASIGRSSVADDRIARGNVNQHVCIIRPIQEKLDFRFLNFVILSKSGQKQIDSFQSGSNREGLNYGQIRSFKIAKPIQIKEQKAIAQTLSDVDALIEALDKLIAKKRNIKTATMQQLLTGKTRLPGFGEGKGYKKTEVGVIPEDWEVRKIENLGSNTIPPIKAGPFGSHLTKNTYVCSGYKIYGQEQVIRGDYLYGDYFISAQKFKELESCAVRPGDILLSLVGTMGKLLVIPENAPLGIINPRLIRLSFDKDIVNSQFFKELFESGKLQGFLARYAQGGTMGVLNAGILRTVSIGLPSITEQKAIAQVLSDIDTEITALEKRRAKTQAIKQGMMQELLTGRTRLINN